MGMATAEFVRACGENNETLTAEFVRLVGRTMRPWKTFKARY